MKKSYLVTIALVGIAISGTTVMIYLNSLQPGCILDSSSNGTCANSTTGNAGRSVEIEGLNTTYDWKQSIEFTLLAHGFDGCEQIHIQIFDELKNRSEPATYDDIIRINDCRNSQTTYLKEYSFPVKISPLNLPQGRYFLLVTHAHTRTDIRTIEQSFEIAHLPATKEEIANTPEEFSYSLDAGTRGLFEINGSVNGAKLSGMTFGDTTNSIRIGLEESDNGKITITIPRKLFDPKIGNEDDDFIVLADNSEVEFDETATDSERTLIITFPAKTSEIEIIETFPLSGKNQISAALYNTEISNS